jgi:lipid-A-disaccharide synthase
VKILISCGEPSGDLYAGALSAELLRLDPGADVTGLGGEHLRAGGGRLIVDYRGMAVTGLIEALRVVPRSLRVYWQLVATAKALRPDVFVAIDFPDFNFRVARRMKRLGIPVVYYIPPQLWAWRTSRIRQLQAFASRVLVIFPFEEALYRQAGVPVEFVGHPLLDLARAQASREAFLESLALDSAAPVVGLLPGSRANEVARLLPVLWQAAADVADAVPTAQFVVARAPHLDDRLFRDVPVIRGRRPVIVTAQTDDVLRAADAVVTASGTATVQAAIHGAPMVVVYRLSPLTYAVGKRFVHVSTYAMVNLIAGRTIVPELIQEQCTPKAIAGEVVRYLTDPAHAARTRAALADVRARLGRGGASARAAQAVLHTAG